MMRLITVGVLPVLLLLPRLALGTTVVLPDDPIPVSDLNTSFVGESADDQFGLAIAFVDINRDLWADLFVGAPHADCKVPGCVGDECSTELDCGKVYVFFGSRDMPWPGQTPADMADMILVGQPGDQLGASFSNGINLNGDQYTDIAIGAAGAENNGGVVYILFGSYERYQSGDSGYIDEFADVRIAGVQGEVLGYAMSNAGDLNHDRLEDIVLGTYRHDTPDAEFVGKAYVLFGRASSEDWPANANIDDIADGSFIGDTGTENFGNAVAGGWDLNNDVYDDIVIGSPGDVGAQSQMGRISIIFGHDGDWPKDQPISEVADVFYNGEDVEQEAGTAVVMTPDANKDFIGDIIVGAPKAVSGATGAVTGRVYMIYGKAEGWQRDNSLSDADVIWDGESYGDNAGKTLAVVGDIEIDSIRELIVGAYLADDGGQDAGKAYGVFLPVDSADGVVRSLAAADLIFVGDGLRSQTGLTLGGFPQVFQSSRSIPTFIGAPKKNVDGLDKRGIVYDFESDLVYDNDNDSYSPIIGDCNDSDPYTFPDAEEMPYDGIDQNCDGADLVDVDGDGYDATQAGGDDCDDEDPDINPSMVEVCNGLDDDCNSLVDDGVQTFYYLDVDGDGYGTPDDEVAACDEAPEGYVAATGDCDDENPNVHPDAYEVCASPPDVDGVDDDCSGVADDRDMDGDGSIDEACGGDDCDDFDMDIHPGAEDIPYDGIDQDCSGSDNDDLDGDGYPGVGANLDCNDHDPTISPGAPEVVCDGIDQNCDGVDSFDGDGDGFKVCNLEDGEQQDCDDTDPNAYPGAYDTAADDKDQNCDGVPAHDYDGDGYRDPDDLDCDDYDSSRYPSAGEIPYDGVDQDCDGNDLTDVDQDGFDAQEVDGDDCNDNDPDIYPGATETPYDGIDQDCDGADLADVDGDGYDSDVVGGPDCDDNDPTINPYAPEEPFNDIDENCDGLLADQDHDGYNTYDDINPDCDDTDPNAYPGAPEVPYDGIDQDCDGSDLVDVDGDGYDGWAVGGGDCNDEDPAVHPGAEEILDDGIDNNCDGLTDPDDMDGDGYSISPSAAEFDCDDTNPNVYPGAMEVPDLVDNNCDGRVDEHIIEGVQDPGGCVCASSSGFSRGDAAPFVLVLAFLLYRPRRNTRCRGQQ